MTKSVIYSYTEPWCPLVSSTFLPSGRLVVIGGGDAAATGHKSRALVFDPSDQFSHVTLEITYCTPHTVLATTYKAGKKEDSAVQEAFYVVCANGYQLFAFEGTEGWSCVRSRPLSTPPSTACICEGRLAFCDDCNADNELPPAKSAACSSGKLLEALMGSGVRYGPCDKTLSTFISSDELVPGAKDARSVVALENGKIGVLCTGVGCKSGIRVVNVDAGEDESVFGRLVTLPAKPFTSLGYGGGVTVALEARGDLYVVYKGRSMASCLPMDDKIICTNVSVAETGELAAVTRFDGTVLVVKLGNGHSVLPLMWILAALVVLAALLLARFYR